MKKYLSIFSVLALLTVALFTGCDGSSGASGDSDSAGNKGSSSHELTALHADDSHAVDKGVSDWFGRSVAISGDFAFIGAEYGDEGGTDSGAVYVFTKQGDSWVQSQKLQGSNTEAGDGFGVSVAMDGDYAFVGAYKEDGPDNDTRWENGAVYVFKKNDSGTWEEIQILHASDARESRPQHAKGEWFGYSVCVKGNRAIVGSYMKSSNGKRFNGGAYIFDLKSDGKWQETAILEASDAETDDYFGHAVAIDGDYAVVGAFGVNYNARNTGAAYIFEKKADGSWEEVKIYHASDYHSKDYLGISVGISGDYIILGAYLEDGGPMYLADGAGAVYVLKRGTEGNWNENQILYASDLQVGDILGWSVSIDGDYIVTGAFEEDGGSGSPVKDAGAVYIFKKNDEGLFSETGVLHAYDMGTQDRFGYSVAVKDGQVIIGAPLEDEVDNSVTDAGAVYFYDID